MQDTKEQVLVGLRFKDACIAMSAKDHKDEDELLADLRKLERITEARMQQYPGAKPHGGDPGSFSGKLCQAVGRAHPEHVFKFAVCVVTEREGGLRCHNGAAGGASDQLGRYATVRAGAHIRPLLVGPSPFGLGKWHCWWLHCERE
ncbi:hypothetical protein HPB50_025275 [Hyalomma asiaticum]|uniref:Uncharacterized protein n=1 Tax=Hyalomma asiaticum TaxID=266040 RepID=A0ACB7RXR0_HYAAI|nr:hypothetical protein HPB50_025275 [Hyalomma asiaticum]